jgi:hypothetical protein
MSGPAKIDRKLVVAINKRHQSNKAKLRLVAKRASKK